MATLPARIEHEHGPPVAFDEYSLDTWQIRFLDAYAEIGSVEGAARKAKINPRYHYTWIRDNSDYSVCYARAREMYSDIAEGEIRRRGIKGYDKQLSYKGLLTGHKTREYSDTLAMAVIKALKPEYRDGQQIAVGPAKIAIEIINSAGDLTRSSAESNTIELNVSADLGALENKASAETELHNSSETAKLAILNEKTPQRLIKRKK